MRRTSSHRLTLGLAGLVGVVAACATIYVPQAPPECRSDDDCDKGQICNVDQGRRCVGASETPRRSAFGVVISAPSLAVGETTVPKIHLSGCDLRPQTSSTQLVLSQSHESTLAAVFRNVTAHRSCKNLCADECRAAEVHNNTAFDCVAARLGNLSLDQPSPFNWLTARPELTQRMPAARDWQQTDLAVEARLRCAPASGEPGAHAKYAVVSARQQSAVEDLRDPDSTDTTSESGETTTETTTLATTDATDTSGVTGIIEGQPPALGTVAAATPKLWAEGDKVPTLRAEAPIHAALFGLACNGAKELEFGLDSHWNCEGEVETTVEVRDSKSSPIDGTVTVEFIHADAIGGAQTVIRPNEHLDLLGQSLPREGTGITCRNHQECVNHPDLGPAFACGDDFTCGLDLRGRSAGTGTGKVRLDGTLTSLAVPVATYGSSQCFNSTPGNGIERSYTIKISASPATNLITPEMTQTVKLKFRHDGHELMKAELRLCLPAWLPNTTRPLSFTSPQVNGITYPLQYPPSLQLTGGRKCCTASCLADSGAPEDEPETCAATEPIFVSATWAMSKELEEAWEADRGRNCQDIDDRLHAGTFERIANCTADGNSCDVDLPIFDDPLECLSFRARVVRPAESLYRSWRSPLPVQYCGADQPAKIPADAILTPRPIIRGRIGCVADETLRLDCDESIRVVVMAERLAKPAEKDPANAPLGPFFFTQRVRTGKGESGEFALPVEPGRYVITALPEPGQGNGPAEFQVVDVSDGSSALVLDNGIWTTRIDDAATQLALRPGIPVRVTLAGYGDGATVFPLDKGSWVGNPDHVLNREGIDLNATTTCLPFGRGCQIRTLRPVSSNGPVDSDAVSLDFSGTAHFTTRNGGLTNCPESMF